MFWSSNRKGGRVFRIVLFFLLKVGVTFHHGMLCVGCNKNHHHLIIPTTASDLFPSEAGNLYVADFGNFCVVRFSLDDAAAKGGAVVVGVRGKQLMDIDYLKASASAGLQVVT